MYTHIAMCIHIDIAYIALWQRETDSRTIAGGEIQQPEAIPRRGAHLIYLITNYGAHASPA